MVLTRARDSIGYIIVDKKSIYLFAISHNNFLEFLHYESTPSSGKMKIKNERIVQDRYTPCGENKDPVERGRWAGSLRDLYARV